MPSILPERGFVIRTRIGGTKMLGTTVLIQNLFRPYVAALYSLSLRLPLHIERLGAGETEVENARKSFLFFDNFDRRAVRTSHRSGVGVDWHTDPKESSAE